MPATHASLETDHRRGAAGASTATLPIPILFLGTTFAVGGAERVLAHLIRGLDRSRFRPELVALRAPGPVAEELRGEGLPVHAGLTGPARFDLRLVPRIRRLLLRGGFRAIYFLDHAHAVFHGVIAAAGTPARVRVMPVHTTGQWNGQPSLKRPIRLVRSRLDRIIAIADAQREYLVREEGVPREQITVIPNGVPLARPGERERRERRAAARARLSTPEAAPVIGITAVLRPEKNHELLLRAFARIRAAHPQAELWVLGDGPRRPFLVAEAGRLGLSCGDGPGQAVRLLGHRPDARALIPGFDVVSLASHPRVETLPLSLIEAMDEALPVVATRVGALAEMVEEGESGYLVEPGDEAGLAEAFARLLAAPELRRRLGERGQAIAAERYSVERMVAGTEALLLELLRRT